MYNKCFLSDYDTRFTLKTGPVCIAYKSCMMVDDLVGVLRGTGRNFHNTVHPLCLGSGHGEPTSFILTHKQSNATN